MRLEPKQDQNQESPNKFHESVMSLMKKPTFGDIVEQAKGKAV